MQQNNTSKVKGFTPATAAGTRREKMVKMCEGQMTSASSTVEEQSNQHSMVEGLSPVAADALARRWPGLTLT